MMMIYLLAIIILWSTPAWSVIETDTPSSSPKTHNNEQIDDTHILVNDIRKLYLSDSFSDVVLVVDEERLPAHRIVLASRSEYFRVCFNGKFTEAHALEVPISEASVTLFKKILKYIYTGRINLNGYKDIEVFELLKVSDFYSVSNLKISLLKYLQNNINAQNACLLYAGARFYQYKDLEVESINFIDINALVVLQSEEFLSLSIDDLQEILHRDTLYADELGIFRAVCRWIEKNQNELDRDSKINVLSAVRYQLMSVEELSEARGELQLVSSDINLDAIQFRHTWSPDKLQFRGHLKPNVNLIYESKNIPDTDDFDEGTNMLKLNNPSIINFIETIFWYEYRMDELKCFSYYIELSMNGHDWVRVLDHSNYNCRSFQRLWIHPRLVRYIHIVGTRSTANETFSFLDVKYNTEDMHKVEIKNGLVVPKFGYNVTSQYMGAFVIKGENNSNDGSLVKGYYESQARNDRYTYHELGSGFIVVQLALPYILSSMRLLLWGDDSYSYTIEASINNEEWEIIVDKSEELTQSWQVLQFKSRPILYIRITGVKSSAGNVFRIIYLEAPAQVALDSNIVEDNRAVTNYGRLTKRFKAMYNNVKLYTLIVRMEEPFHKPTISLLAFVLIGLW